MNSKINKFAEEELKNLILERQGTKRKRVITPAIAAHLDTPLSVETRKTVKNFPYPVSMEYRPTVDYGYTDPVYGDVRGGAPIPGMQVKGTDDAWRVGTQMLQQNRPGYYKLGSSDDFLVPSRAPAYRTALYQGPGSRTAPLTKGDLKAPPQQIADVLANWSTKTRRAAARKKRRRGQHPWSPDALAKHLGVNTGIGASSYDRYLADVIYNPNKYDPNQREDILAQAGLVQAGGAGDLLGGLKQHRRVVTDPKTGVKTWEVGGEPQYRFIPEFAPGELAKSSGIPGATDYDRLRGIVGGRTPINIATGRGSTSDWQEQGYGDIRNIYGGGPAQDYAGTPWEGHAKPVFGMPGDEGYQAQYFDPETGTVQYTNVTPIKPTGADFKLAIEGAIASGEMHPYHRHTQANLFKMGAHEHPAVKRRAFELAKARLEKGYEGTVEQRNLAAKEKYFPPPVRRRHGIDVTLPAMWPFEYGMQDFVQGLGGVVADTINALGGHQPDPNKPTALDLQGIEMLAQWKYEKSYDELTDKEKSNLTNISFAEEGVNPAYLGEIPYQLGVWDAMIAKDLAVGTFRAARATARRWANWFRGPGTELAIGGEKGLLTPESAQAAREADWHAANALGEETASGTQTAVKDTLRATEEFKVVDPKVAHGQMRARADELAKWMYDELGINTRTPIQRGTGKFTPEGREIMEPTGKYRYNIMGGNNVGEHLLLTMAQQARRGGRVYSMDFLKKVVQTMLDFGKGANPLYESKINKFAEEELKNILKEIKNRL